MSCPLANLAPELQLTIIDFLLSEDLAASYALSSTCSFCRYLLAPYIFKSIPLRNTAKSGASVSALARSPHGKHVKTIYYTGSAPGRLVEGYRDNDEDYWDTENVFPESVNTVLSNLSEFPSLQTWSIGFFFNHNNDHWPDPSHMFEVEETASQVALSEVDEGW
ncbi:hypothetical protein MMC20_003034 [Loxospora ochrophaea]|nr:hypothetical protein [Loxospora ochrophaea]